MALTARDFFAIPISGVGVERLFNSVRDICHYRRSRLHPETINALMFQMCTDRFEIKRGFQQIQEDLEEQNILIGDIFEKDNQVDIEIPNYISVGDDSDEEDIEVPPRLLARPLRQKL